MRPGIARDVLHYPTRLCSMTILPISVSRPIRFCKIKRPVRLRLRFCPFLLKNSGREIGWYHKAIISAGVLVNLWVYCFGWYQAY